MKHAYMVRGGNQKDFWELSPKEYYEHKLATDELDNIKSKHDKSIAWLSGTIAKSSKFIPLEKLLGEPTAIDNQDMLIASLTDLTNSLPAKSWHEWQTEFAKNEARN